MEYATLWTIGAGVLLAGYLALAGIDYGVAILLPYVARRDGERRLALNAVGPFFLANEVWLLAAVGMMIGTLPGLESRLLAGTYPLVIVAVAGVVLVNVSVQLRSRGAGARQRAFWDALICLGGLAAAFGWGAVLTVLVGGFALDSGGHVTSASGSVTLFSVTGGAATVVMLSAHGAVFLTARTYGAVAARSQRVVPLLSVAASLLTVSALVAGRVSGPLDDALRRPALGLALLLAALVALKVAYWQVARGRPWHGLLASAVGVGLMPLTIFLAKYPALITSRDSGGHAPSTDELAGSPTALALITWTAGPALLLVIAVQAYGWWVFRGRVGPRSPVFY
jgi:cytochrome bd ubiquinol oxidase subunit II